MRLHLLAAALVLGAAHHTVVSRPADPCTNPADRTAFDIEGLKSELMVTALSCKIDRDRPFLSRYGTYIASEEKVLDAYFRRVYGRQYQHAHDDYITNLANVQSQDALKAGTAFCDNLPAMFDEVMSLHSSGELDDFVASQPIVQPVSFTTCAASATPVRSLRHARHTKKKA